MSKIICIFLLLALASCSSAPKKPKIGECFQKQTSDYGETIYKVLDWENGVFPKAKNTKTNKIRVMTEYNPQRYQVVNCP